MVVKVVNDLAGPEGLIPTLLVYSAFPRMVEANPPALSIQQRATAIRKAMVEVARVRAKMQVNNAIHTRNGPITESLHELPPNSKVLVYREEGGWKGPYILIGIAGETYKVQLLSGPTDFRTTVVKPYFEKPE